MICPHCRGAGTLLFEVIDHTTPSGKAVHRHEVRRCPCCKGECSVTPEAEVAFRLGEILTT